MPNNLIKQAVHSNKLPLWRRLKVRFLALMSLILLVSFSSAWYISLSVADSEFKHILHDQFHQRFSEIQAGLGQLAQVAMIWSENLAEAPSIKKALNGELETQKIRRVQQKSRSDILAIADDTGRILHASDGFFQQGDQVDSWQIVHSAMSGEAQSFIVSQYNRFFMFAAAPIKLANGSIKGVLLLGYILGEDYLANYRQSGRESGESSESVHRHPPSHIVFIRTRAVMASTFATDGHKLENLPLDYLTYQLLLTESEQFEYVDLFGETYCIDGEPLKLMQPGTNGSILLAFSASHITNLTKSLTRRYTFLFGTVFLFVLLMISYVGRYILAPVLLLTELSDEVAKGNLQVTLPKVSNDEIGLLSEHFAQMVHALNKSRTELIAHQDSLEKDVAERTAQLSEANLQLILQKTSLEEAQHIASLGNWTYDPLSGNFQASDETARMFGLSRQQNITLEDFLKVVVDEDEDIKQAKKLFEPQREERVPRESNYRINPPGSPTLYIYSRAVEVLYERKSLIIGTVLDVTKRTQREKDLMSAKREAESANRQKDNLISIVAHDLKGPISGSIGLLELIQADQDHGMSPEHQEMLNAVLLGLKPQLTLIKNLLNLQRVQRGSFRLENQWLDLHALMEGLQKQLHGLLVGKKIAFNNEVPLETMVYADPNFLTQVFHNLITNSVKFSRKGESIRIWAKDATCFVVEDSGIGIKAERIKTLFDLDQTTSTPGTEGEAGTGYGLPLCQEILKAHGGHLKVESEPDQGSRFYVHLPNIEPDK